MGKKKQTLTPELQHILEINNIKDVSELFGKSMREWMTYKGMTYHAVVDLICLEEYYASSESKTHSA